MGKDSEKIDHLDKKILSILSPQNVAFLVRLFTNVCNIS